MATVAIFKVPVPVQQHFYLRDKFYFLNDSTHSTHFFFLLPSCVDTMQAQYNDGSVNVSDTV